MQHYHVPTPADVRKNSAYWVAGPGYEQASQTQCSHGYNLTDTCPCCDAESEEDDDA